jgi:hypothetical protein
LEGLCKTLNCQAYKERVWIQKGYGKFNINKEVYDSQCPMCKKTVTDVDNMALYMGKITATGRIKGEEEPKTMQSFQNIKD